MKSFSFLAVLAAIGQVFGQSEYPQIDAWFAQPSIRVGLSTNDSYEFYCNETLLVLDGNKVVETISPGGKFYVVARPVAGEPARWLQIRASRSRELVESERERLASQYPDYSFVVRNTRDDIWAVRLGPLETLAAGEVARKLIAKNGYPDCYLLTDRREYEFQWVDHRFDKYPLRANDPGIVRFDPDQTIAFNGNEYRGMLRFRMENERLLVINQLPLETYLRGVVPSEMGPMSYPELEAQKAQAIAARTYAVKNLRRFDRKGYDICDGPACQAYEGTKNESPLSDQAVKETEGLVLTHEGKLIDALYTSTDGGSTEDVEKVFPNRSEPYLRAKTGYVATLKRFELPTKVVDRSQFVEGSEELGAKLVLWGFAAVPDLRGQFTGQDLKTALGQFAWVLGNDPVRCADGPISNRDFWTALANLEFFKAAAARQVVEADLQIMLRSYSLPDELRSFAGLAVRYELVNADRLATFSSTAPISRGSAYRMLIELCQALGPTPNWQRYRVERVVDDVLEVSRGGQTKTLDLKLFSHYVTYVGERIEFIDKPQVEEWDRIYLLDEPFTAKILRVRESGSVASVDRFSAYDSWIEKKTLAELEARVRRYVPELRGLRNVRILSRSDTGRVTQLAFDADSGVHQVDGLNVRWSLGVRENLFDLIPGYRDGKLVHLTVLGRGWGHGVGMSQVGAFTLARMGWDYQKILTYYYTGVEVRSLSELTAF